MSLRKILYVFSHAPYSSSQGQEALDAVLIGAAFEQTVSVLFIHDGVFQLKGKQNVESSELKEFTKAYRALNDFGVERIYVHDLGLVARGLTAEQLMMSADIVNSDEVRKLIAEQDKVFTF